MSSCHLQLLGLGVACYMAKAVTLPFRKPVPFFTAFPIFTQVFKIFSRNAFVTAAHPLPSLLSPFSSLPKHSLFKPAHGGCAPRIPLRIHWDSIFFSMTRRGEGLLAKAEPTRAPHTLLGRNGSGAPFSTAFSNSIVGERVALLSVSMG